MESFVDNPGLRLIASSNVRTGLLSEYGSPSAGGAPRRPTSASGIGPIAILARLDPKANPAERRAAMTAIDDTMYGPMMVLDGVTGVLRDSERSVVMKTLIQLRHGDDVVAEMDAAGEGMCMGYHGWMDGSFGDDPVVSSRT